MIIEELKQRVTAKSQRIKRYESRVEQYDQNRFFEINRKRLFEHLKALKEEKMNYQKPRHPDNFGRECGTKMLNTMKKLTG